MDSKLEARIDEIFMDVPKSDKIVTMINRIKSKANAKFLEIRNNGYSRSVAFNEVDDWLMKAKIIVDEEAGKLTPAEIAALPKRTEEKSGPVVSEAVMDDGEVAVVVERDEAPVYEDNSFTPMVDMTYAADPEPVSSVYDAPAEEAAAAPAEEPSKPEKKAKKEPKAAKPAKKSKNGKKSKRAAKDDATDDDVEVPANKPSGKVGKILGILCLVAGVALIVIAVLILLGVIA